MRNLTIMVALTILVALSMAGCVPQQGNVRDTTAPRLDELERKQELLTLRMNELAQRLLDVQARLDKAEDFALRPAPKEEPPEVIKLTPPVVEAVPVVKVAPVEQSQPVEQKAAQKTAQQEQPKVAADAATRAYQSAFALYRKGEYAKAILDFEEFVGRHPDHEYADSAQFWIGESYFSQGVYEQAIVEFNRVIDSYPRGKRAPDAQLMIGDSYEKLGQPDRARAAYNRLIAQHPASEAAYMAKKRNNTP